MRPQAATVRVASPETGAPVDTVIPYVAIDRARTVFVWGPAPKPGGGSQRTKKQTKKKKAAST